MVDSNMNVKLELSKGILSILKAYQSGKLKDKVKMNTSILMNLAELNKLRSEEEDFSYIIPNPKVGEQLDEKLEESVLEISNIRPFRSTQEQEVIDDDNFLCGSLDKEMAIDLIDKQQEEYPKDNNDSIPDISIIPYHRETFISLGNETLNLSQSTESLFEAIEKTIDKKTLNYYISKGTII